MIELSIIIPVYKVRDYIAKCLESIESQDVNKEFYEVIIVNDGTPDDSMEIAAPIIERMGNATVIDQENQGLSAARNAGLEKASGEYVWFVDSDDWLLPGAIKEVFYNIHKFPYVDVFSSVLQCYYESNGKTLPEYNPDKGLIKGKDYLKKKYRQGAIQRFVFKRNFLDNNSLRFYPGILHEDSLFGFEMLYLAENVFVLDHMIYAYRLRESGSIMSSISMRSPNDLLRIHKLLKEFMITNVKPEDTQWYRLIIFHIIDCIYGFSRPILSTNEFKKFYEKNKDYLRDESEFLYKAPVSKMYAFRMVVFPVTYMKIKYQLGKIKKFIQCKFRRSGGGGQVK